MPLDAFLDVAFGLDDGVRAAVFEKTAARVYRHRSRDCGAPALAIRIGHEFETPTPYPEQEAFQ